MTNTGTCPACDRLMKLRNGLIVNHGFTRQEGFHKGRCPGVGQKPWEVSPEGRIHLISELRDMQRQLRESGNSDARFIDGIVEKIEGDIKKNQEKLDKWQPKDLP